MYATYVKLCKNISAMIHNVAFPARYLQADTLASRLKCHRPTVLIKMWLCIRVLYNLECAQAVLCDRSNRKFLRLENILWREKNRFTRLKVKVSRSIITFESRRHLNHFFRIFRQDIEACKKLFKRDKFFASLLQSSCEMAPHVSNLPVCSAQCDVHR